MNAFLVSTFPGSQQGVSSQDLRQVYVLEILASKISVPQGGWLLESSKSG